MEDTACKEKCPYVVNGWCKSCEGCPNYVESWWIEDGKEQPRLVRDCAPKRMMAQLCSLETKFLGVQAAAEQARNETNLMRGHFMQLVDATRASIEEREQKKIAVEVRKMIE